MASELGVQTIQHTNGTDALTVGSDGVVTAASYIKQSAVPTFKAVLTATQNIPNAAHTEIQFNSTVFDVGRYFNTSTYRYHPLVAGYYLINASVMIQSTTPDYVEIKVSKNSSATPEFLGRGTESNSVNVYVMALTSGIVYLNGSTDYVTASVVHNIGSTQTISANNHETYLTGYLIG